MATKRTLEFEILAETRKATKNLQAIKKELGAMDAKIAASKKNAKTFSSSFGDLAKVAVGFIGIQKAIQGVSAAVATMSDFESQIAKLGAISGATATELSAMEEEAKRLGATTQYTASQVAEAMNFLAMAGYDANQILSATEGVLNLATVGMMDLGEAADIASNVLSGFGLEAEETGRVVDVMSKTITTSNTNIQELGAAMSKVAPVAASLGVSLEETSAILGVYADAGIKAEMAGTQLKMSLIQLGADDKAASQLKALGLSAFDAKGNFKGMITILSELKPKLAELTQEARLAAMVEIFGKRNIASANVALEMLDNVKEKYKQNTNAAGTAQKIAAKFMDTLSGAFKEMNSALEAVILDFSDELIPIMREALAGATDWLRSLDKEDIRAVGEAITTIATSIGLVIDGIKLLNDIAIPDILTDEENYGASDAIVDALEAMNTHVRALKGAFEETFNMSDTLLDATAQFEDLAEQVKYFGGTSGDLDVLTASIEAQIIANGKSIQKWAVHERSTQKAKDAEKQLNDEITSLAKLLETVQSMKDVHKPQIDSAEDATAAEEELAKKIIHYSDVAVAEMKKNGEKRVKDYDKNLADLKKSEASLLKDIEKMNAAHQKKLKELDSERVDNLRDAEFDIQDIRRSGMTDYNAYVATQLEADKALAEARKLLEAGKFEDAEAYFSRYQSLVRESAGTEIKEGKVVKLTKAQTSDEAISDIQEEKKFIEEMYEAKKQAANEAYEQSIKEKKAQLDSVRAQIEVQQQLIVVVKALVEVLGGNVLEIDTQAGTEAIDALAERSKELDKELDDIENKKLSPDVDGSSIDAATEKVKGLKNEISSDPAKLKVEAEDNTTPEVTDIKDGISGEPAIMTISAADGTEEKQVEIKDKIAGASAIMTITAEDGTNPTYQAIQSTYQGAGVEIDILGVDKTDKTITEVKDKTEKETAEINLEANDEVTPVVENIKKEDGSKVTMMVLTDTKTGTEEVIKLRATTEEPVTMPVMADNSDVLAKDAANRAAIAQPSLHTIQANDSAVQAAKAAASRPTSSQHTIYVKTVKTNALGGPVFNGVAQRLAEGGESGDFTTRMTGKVAGHDLSGSDDVPTLLTRGEYIQNVRAVDYYGSSFMAALNSMQIPREQLLGSAQRLAAGGGVGVPPITATGAGDLVPININFGTKQFAVKGESSVAADIVTYLQEEGGL